MCKEVPYGKYVIICDSRKRPGSKMYLQDKTIDDIGFWTSHLHKAYGFNELAAALERCKRLKYNNPRVAHVDSNGLLEVFDG